MLFSIKTLCVESPCDFSLAAMLFCPGSMFARFVALFSLGAAVGMSSAAQADLRNWGGFLEVLSVGSVPDKVLWNLRPTLNVKGEQPILGSKSWSLGVDTRLRVDTQADFLRTQNRYDFRFDKAALQWVGDSASVSFGWQKFTWGDTAFLDGVDVLNARDLSEPLYTDDELLKLAVPALSLQYLASSTVFQLVLIPLPERSPVPESAAGLVIKAPDELAYGEQLEFGLKAGGLLKSGWDINGYLASHLERIPQLRLVFLPQGTQARLYEPRVFTLGLTATQSLGDFVFRCEVAAHINRALPEVGLQNESSSDQFVLNLTTDLTLLDDFLISGQVWAEQWSAPSSQQFTNADMLLGTRLQKPFFSGRLEASAGAFGSFSSNESLITSGLNFRVFDSLQFSFDAYFAQTSKGHALERRQFKDLLRSSLKYQF
ncbi:MAG: hypothetical protein RI932_2562 [Pseudomonadota bacterium]|jgi:hypothetical protein